MPPQRGSCVCVHTSMCAFVCVLRSGTLPSVITPAKLALLHYFFLFKAPHDVALCSSTSFTSTCNFNEH